MQGQKAHLKTAAVGRLTFSLDISVTVDRLRDLLHTKASVVNEANTAHRYAVNSETQARYAVKQCCSSAKMTSARETERT